MPCNLGGVIWGGILAPIAVVVVVVIVATTAMVAAVHQVLAFLSLEYPTTLARIAAVGMEHMY
jgi:hypothetical protein